MKKELQRNVNGMTSGGGSIQHPFSIHSASIGTRWKLHGLQSLMMTILLLFTMGIGQMWGTTSYYNLFYNGTDKSVDGSTINSEDFKYFGATINTSASSTEIDGNTYTHFLKLANYTSSIAADSMKVLAYDAKTTHTKVTAYVKNGDSNNRDFYIGRIVEGETSEQTGSGKQVKQNVVKGNTAKITFELDNTKNTLIGLFGAGKATWEIYQVIIEESGTPLLTGGETGYELAFPGRVGASGKFTAKTTPTIIDGMELRASNSLKYLAGPLKIKQTNSYIKFTLISAQTVKVTPYNTRKFIFSTTATPSGSETKYGGTAASEVSVVLTEGTYFLESENSSELQLSKLAFADPPTPHTLSYAVSPTGKGTVTLGATSLVEGAQTTATYSAIDGAYEFDEWQISGTGATLSSTSTNPTTITMGSTDATVTLKLKEAVTKYTITYSKGANGTGTAIPNGKKDEGVDFTLSDATYDRDGYVQTGWATEDGGAKAYDLGGTYSTDADEELFPFWTPVYTVTKGTHEHGDFTISPASLVAGGTVTLDPTPADGYMFSAWEVVKTSDASATGITVTNKQFEMPAYGVTVNATFVTDTRKKVLYLTTTNEATTIANDKLYAALKDDYKVTIAAPDAQTLTNYDLVVLHESINGKAAAPDDATNRKQAVLDAKTTSVPVLNTKTYFYNSGRWDWGTPNNGQAAQKVATLNSGYCNVADHPIFAGVTITAGAVTVLTNDATGNTMQPVAPSSGKEGYLLATTPNASSGVGYAIQEIPAGGFRGALSGKYILISVSNAGLNNLTTDGQKLFKNAADYLTSATTWTPVAGLTNAEIDATGNPFSEGATMTLTASATGATAATTYAWYKGATWSEAEAGGAIQAAKTAENSGHIYTKTAAAEDAGKYWCVMVKSTGCEVTASVEVSVLTCTKPGTPANLAASNLAYTTADLSWNAADNSDGYKISIIKKDDESVIVDWTDNATTSYAATGLTQGTEYTFKVKAKGATGYCEFGLEATVDFTTTAPSVADLVTIADDYTYTPSVSIPAGTLSADSKFFAAGTGDCDMSDGKMRVKENRALAFKVADNAKIKVTFATKSGRQIQLGTALSEGNYTTYGSSESSPYTFDVVTTGGVVYLTAHSDQLYFSKLEITYPHTVTYDLNGGTGDPAPTQASKYVGETFTAHDGVTGITAPATKEFDKWVDQDAADVAAGTTYTMPAKNVTLTAQWRDVTVKYAVTYDLADYTAGVAPTETDKAEGDVFAIKAAPARSGYAFMGWLCDIDAQTYQATNNYTMTAAPTTFTAVWKQEFQVAFNLKGHGDPIAAQIVLDGGKVTKPTNPSEEGWAFGGWFKETTCVNEWNFASDVVTEDTELFAKWEDETTAIKLIVDDTPSGKKINDEAYYTGSPLTTVTISTIEYPCVKLAGGANATTAPYGAGQNDNRVIAYCATTTATKIQVIAYSSTTSARPYTISFVEEGQTADQADDNNVIVNLPTDKTIHTSDWYTFNSTKNRTIYITIPGNNGDYHFLQVKVIESGTPIKKAGDLGYSMNFNIGRPIGVKQTLHKNFEGFDFYANNDYKVLQSTSMAISNATNDYIKFHAAAPMTLAVTTENAASFYVTKAAKGTDNETLSTAGGTSYIDLDAAADWYISPKGGDVKIQKIEFIAPKCAEPTITPMINVDLCEGDAFTPITVTATVSDGGTRHYQWYKEAGADDEAVGTDNASFTPDADGDYYVVVTNQKDGFSDNSATSNTITVEHFASAVITTAPAIQRKEAGQLATLTVVATGKAPLTYQWYTCDDEAGSNPVIIEGADEATYEVTVTVGMSQYYKVVVGSGCGSAEAVTLVEEWHEVAPANVTGSRTWDWAAENMGTIETVSGSTEYLMANVSSQVPNTEAFRSDMLYITANYANRSASNKFFQGWQIRFYTEVPGKVSLNCRAIHGTMSVTINGTVIDAAKGSDMGNATTPFFVPAGWVTIAFDNQSSGNEGEAARVQKIVFNTTPDYTRGVTEGRFGTICLPNGGVMVGADIFEVAYMDYQAGHPYKIYFDEVLNGEMVAGRPYVFLPQVGATQLGVFYTDDAGAAAGNYKGLYGSYTRINVPMNDGNYILLNNQYYFVDTDNVYCGANKAYIKLAGVPNYDPGQPAYGRRRISMGVNSESTATAIDELNASETPVKIMIDGTMYILRGEKMYDATGRLVK